MRVLVISLLALTLLAGCVHTPAPATVSEATSRIIVERDAQPGFWRATYELSEPATNLRFERTPFRRGVFEVLTEGFTIERDGDTEVLRTSGSPARQVTVRFPEFSEELEKEYDFFQKFTDGSVAIYTGHLAVRVGADAANPSCTSCAVRRFRFLPPSGHHVIVGGKVVRGPAEWTDPEEQGAYIYIGGIEPLQTNELVAVVDPGLPRWLWEETRTTLPRLFTLYATRFGITPTERPLVLFNYMDRGGSGYSTGGGILPGQIQLTADGAAWKERSDDALVPLLSFLAHESAHLWNGRIIFSTDSAHAWMHEGSADGLAQRTLRELGILDESAYLAKQAEALNECRRKLGGFPLRDAAKRNEFGLYYSCGNALALLTEQAIDDKDLFGFWKTLIARVRAANRTTFETSDYYAALSASGASAETIAQLRTFVEEAATDEALTTMLRANGVMLTESTPPEAWGQTVSRDALFRLLGELCTGPYGFRTVRNGLSLTSTNQCPPLPAGVTVTAIGNHHVLRNGGATWGVLHERCGTTTPIAVTVTDGTSPTTIEVPCRKPVAAPIQYLTIAALPDRFAATLPSRPPVLSENARVLFEKNLADARAAYEKAPKDADAILWLGRRTAYLGRYAEAIDIFSEGVQAHPQDARMLRHRGHRWITLRAFGRAIDDLERAARMVRGTADQIEPDGLPNERNIPTSTLQSNIFYHLGLAHYLRGDLEPALAAYRECAVVSNNPDGVVSSAYWIYSILRRLGRDDDARAVLEPIRADMDIIENGTYHQLLLMARGEIDPATFATQDPTTVDGVTLLYGLGNWYLYNEQPERAKAIFETIVAGPQWSSFGYIAAEAELSRMR
jgi:tetratricopeptide (TPR) repeat protein